MMVATHRSGYEITEKNTVIDSLQVKKHRLMVLFSRKINKFTLGSSSTCF